MKSNLLNWVNPLQGTDSHPDFSRGNTLPLLCTPFPMTAWTMQTGTGRWIYQWSTAKLQGLRATHQPSPWMGDHGHFTLMPQTGEFLPEATERSSAYNKADTIVRPDYLSVNLLRYRCRLEATPSERCVVLRLHFSGASTGRLLIDCFGSGGNFELSEDGRTVTGCSSANYGGTPDNFAQWFTIVFANPIKRLDFAPPPTLLSETRAMGINIASAEFDIPADGIVECTVATSFISPSQALTNLTYEIGNRSFEQVRATTAQSWEQRLSAVVIESSNQELRRTFYSCLYRTLTFPHRMHEPDPDGAPVHYSPYSGKIEKGLLFACHGFWDTYRTAYPLYALLWPEDYRNFMEGWINASKEGGWYPRWPSPGYRDCMLSTHVDAVFADALAKGIGSINWEEAYQGLRRHAFEEPEVDPGFGRPGLNSYMALGYIPSERYRHSVAATLDSAYCDFCLAEIADFLNKPEDAAILRARSANYRHVFDPQVGFMRGRLSDGSWETPFNEFRWGGPYVEGSAWQTSWGVPHDIPGLIELYGGKEAFCAKLEQMLSTPAHFESGDYGFEIHEMTEMAVADFGQYAHSNQPVHHVLYLFAEAGAPHLTDRWVRKILTNYYNHDVGGFPGDEDNGEMSAWFVLSALGIFPICPGKDAYTLTVPLFPKATLQLGNSTLEITSQSIPEESTLQFTLDGVPLHGRSIKHSQLLASGHLAFEVASPDSMSESTSQSDIKPELATATT